ncbi:hypothetical protein RRG08_009971 [Elysia crispata]|uniref:Uncharacterized protein n=1 Tax=Elysia crispata TaxID=231223 RepID=A0AAE1B4M6_9GAST|nr:hypothetical protein RRG08_009971 [Elysia crispata]
MFSSLDENVEIVVDESRAGGMSGRFKWNVIVLMIESSIDLTAVRDNVWRGKVYTVLASPIKLRQFKSPSHPPFRHFCTES